MSLSLIETARALASGTMPARACTEHYLRRIRERDASAEHGALHGVPVGVKDIIDTADLPTEMGSRAFPGHRPARDAGGDAHLLRIARWCEGVLRFHGLE